MKKLIISFVALGFLLVASCHQNQTYENTASEAVYEVDNSIDSQEEVSNAAKVLDINKKFVHTADVNMKVKDVFVSTLNIENKALELKGFIEKSELRTQVLKEKEIAISKDSANYYMVYQQTNHLKVRVPQQNLHLFLTEINHQKDFLNYRIIEANDVTFEHQYQNLEQSRLQTSQQQTDKLNSSAYKNQADKLDRKDAIAQAKNENTIQKAVLNDKITLATVEIALVEDAKIKTTVIPNTKDRNFYVESNFGYEIKKTSIIGFRIFKTILLGIVYLWPFIIIVIGLIFGIRFYKNRKKNLV